LASTESSHAWITFIEVLNHSKLILFFINLGIINFPSSNLVISSSSFSEFSDLSFILELLLTFLKKNITNLNKIINGNNIIFK
jgi:hypothetical protein